MINKNEYSVETIKNLQDNNTIYVCLPNYVDINMKLQKALYYLYHPNHYELYQDLSCLKQNNSQKPKQTKQGEPGLHSLNAGKNDIVNMAYYCHGVNDWDMQSYAIMELINHHFHNETILLTTSVNETHDFSLQFSNHPYSLMMAYHLAYYYSGQVYFGNQLLKQVEPRTEHKTKNQCNQDQQSFFSIEVLVSNDEGFDLHEQFFNENESIDWDIVDQCFNDYASIIKPNINSNTQSNKNQAINQKPDQKLVHQHSKQKKDFK